MGEYSLEGADCSFEAHGCAACGAFPGRGRPQGHAVLKELPGLQFRNLEYHLVYIHVVVILIKFLNGNSEPLEASGIVGAPQTTYT